MTRRLLVIGLDGYASSVGDRLIAEGRMPALSALARASARVELDHGVARRTGLAWEHFSTGLDPDAAARWSAVAFDPRTYACRQQSSVLQPFPGRLGLDTVVFDAPYFDLAQAPAVRGLVSWGAHDPGTPPRAHPGELRAEVEARFGPYPATPWIYGFTWPSPTRTREMGAALVEATHRRAQIARWLFRERFPDWSLGIVVVSELHSAVEALWHGVDAAHPLHGLPSAEPARAGLEATFEAVDALVGSLVDASPGTAVLVVSMHGMGPNESDVAGMALLPELLHRRAGGKPALAPAAGVAPDGVPLLDEAAAWGPAVRTGFRRPGPGRARAALRRVWRLPRRKRAKPPGSSIGWMPASWYARAWPRMDAFALPAFYDGQIRVNLAGREAAGRVRLSRYRDFCKQLADDLHACIDPRTGRSAVRAVMPTHRADPRALGATEADLIVHWNGAPLAFEHPRLGTIGPLPFRRPGGHTGGHGFAWLCAPDADARDAGLRSSFDVVPTIVDYLCSPEPQAASGREPTGLSGESFWPDLRKLAR